MNMQQANAMRDGTPTSGGPTGGFLTSILRLSKSSVFRRDRRPSALNTEHWILNTLSLLTLILSLAPRAEAAPSQMKIAFGGYTNRSEVLTNFPVLVVFSNNVGGSSSFNYNNFATTNGYDLRFGTNSTPTTNSLNYEIESWNTNGASYVWVQVPTIPGDGTGAIWANWGNTSASNQLPCTTNGATWSSRYFGVWHLPNGTTLGANDSTAPRQDGTITGVTATNGMSDGGAWFDGVDNRVVEVNNITVNLGNSDWSIGIWVRLQSGHSTAYHLELWTKGSQGWSDPKDKLAYMPTTGGDVGKVGFHDSGGGAPLTTRTINDYNWHYVVHTYVKSTGSLKIYIDGAKDLDTTYATDSGEPNYFNIGKGPGKEWHGAIDEVRIATDVSSTNWVWAEYLNMASNTVFNNYGAASSQAAGGGGTPTLLNQPVTAVSTASATFNGTLTSTGSSACAVCVLWGETDGGQTWNWANTNWLTEPVGGWTNNSPLSTNISLTANKNYFYTYAATNATTNAVAASSKYLITGEVTVQATDSNAQFLGPDGDGQFTIYRPDTCTGAALTVYFTTNGSTASGFTLSPSGSATISAGATSTVVTLTPGLSSVGDGILTLTTGATNVYPVGAMNSATVTIAAADIPAEIFVSTNGTHNYPFSTWNTAATNIQAAIDASDDFPTFPPVTVSNGTYNISAQINVSAAITIRSFGNGVTGGLDNAAATIVKRNSGTCRIFNITGAATVDGFTIRDGSIAGSGAGVLINASGAIVKNCIITGNNVTSGSHVTGGGVYLANGVVSNCTIYGNTVVGNSGTGYGGGVAVGGGLLVACVIRHNTAQQFGGGVQIGGHPIYGAGTVRNCLIYGNTVGQYGGGVGMQSGTNENCTIVANTDTGAGSTSGGGMWRNGGTVRNCIVYNNTCGNTSYQNINGAASTPAVINTCTTLPDISGASNTSADPLFRDTAEGNYGLSVGSPCIDTGTNQPWTATGVDMDGNAREQDGNNDGTARVDMGAYEYNAALNGDFAGSPRALVTSPWTYQCFGPAPFTVQFTGTAYGTNLDTVVYRWDFENNGTWTSWSSGNTASYTYNTVGVYSPKLQVSNAVAQVGEIVKASYVSAGSTYYVTTNGTGNFQSWANAGGTISGAVALCTYNGDQILVSNGTYNITAEIQPRANTFIRSFGNGVIGGTNNAAVTIVKNNGVTGIRIFGIYGVNTTVDGFTIRDALNVNGHGGGVQMTASGALVKNCMITGNSLAGGSGVHASGAGVYLSDGVVSNCTIYGNTSQSHGGTGKAGGVAVGGGLLVACVIRNNTAQEHAGGAKIGGYPLPGAGTVRNCLIYGNTVGQYGGGVHMQGGTSENCTIVANTDTGAGSTSGGGMWRNAGTVRNCIVYSNTCGNASFMNINGAESVPAVTYTCTTNPVAGHASNISADPLFVNPGATNYQLQASSPCVDTGTNQTWMVGALDLAGNDRKLYGGKFGSKGSPIVDMGAYEAPEPQSAGTLFLLR